MPDELGPGAFAVLPGGGALDETTTITVGIKTTLPCGDYTSISPLVTATRKLQPGQTLQDGIRALYKELLPCYGMVVLYELGNIRRGREVGFDELAAELLSTFHGADNLNGTRPE